MFKIELIFWVWNRLPRAAGTLPPRRRVRRPRARTAPRARRRQRDGPCAPDSASGRALRRALRRRCQLGHSQRGRGQLPAAGGPALAARHALPSDGGAVILRCWSMCWSPCQVAARGPSLATSVRPLGIALRLLSHAGPRPSAEVDTAAAIAHWQARRSGRSSSASSPSPPTPYSAPRPRAATTATS